MDSLRYGDGCYEGGNDLPKRRTTKRTAKASPVKVSYMEGFGPEGRLEEASERKPAEGAGLESIAGLWKQYMAVTNRITEALGRSSNIVGEFAERLVAEFYDGTLLAASNKSADIELPDGRLVQVKSRIPRQTTTTSLSTIRSWNFDLLVVVLFNPDGSVLKALECQMETAQRHARHNDYQNADVIVTTDAFLLDPDMRDITNNLNTLIER